MKLETVFRLGVFPLVVASLGSVCAGAVDPLETFVCKTYNNGAVPFQAAQSLGEKHVAQLRELLRDDKKEACWYGVAMSLGAIGTKNAVEILEGFIVSGKGKLTPDAFEGKSGALLALGWAANPVNSDKNARDAAFSYLTAAIDLGRSPLVKLPWSSPYHSDPKALFKSLAGQAIEALGLSGTDSAKNLLVNSAYCKQDLLGTEKNILRSTCNAAVTLIEQTKHGLAKMYPDESTK